MGPGSIEWLFQSLSHSFIVSAMDTSKSTSMPWADEVEAVEFAIKSLALLRRDATWWKDAAEVCDFCELYDGCLWNVLVFIGKSPVHSSTTPWNINQNKQKFHSFHPDRPTFSTFLVFFLNDDVTACGKQLILQVGSYSLMASSPYGSNNDILLCDSMHWLDQWNRDLIAEFYGVISLPCPFLYLREW